jgi:hypothetical protein
MSRDNTYLWSTYNFIVQAGDVIFIFITWLKKNGGYSLANAGQGII